MFFRASAFILSCFVLVSALDFDGALRGGIEEARQLPIHIIPVLVTIIHGAGHAGHAAVHAIASASHLVVTSSGTVKIKFSARTVRVELNNELRDMVYDELCAELIAFAAESNENAEEALAILRSLYDEADELTVDVFVDGKLQCIFEEPESNCIGGDNTILLESNEIKRIRHLQVGDMVQTAPSTFEPVLLLPPHKFVDRNIVEATFLSLKTISGSELVISADHYLPVAGRGLLSASSVRVGDSIFDVWGNQTKVIGVSAQPVKGVYFPLTPSCQLIVEGVQVSCASKSSLSPSVLKMLMSPFYLLHQFLPGSAYTLIHDLSMTFVSFTQERSTTDVLLLASSLLLAKFRNVKYIN